MAFESPVGFAAGGGGGGVLAGIRIGIGDGVGVGGEFDAEKLHGLFFIKRGGGRADEGELRERVDVHEVVGFGGLYHMI